MIKTTLNLVFILTLGFHANATTWFPADHVCPVCKAKNTYQEIGSFGSYIYQWDSKYQYIYWPFTDSPSIYCCPDCHFSTFMGDFDSIPANKIDTIKAFLQTTKFDKEYEDYLNIPITTRLEIAEKVYKILGRNNEFWCQFYRVKGYHYDKKDNEKALKSRTKALELAKLMIADTLNSGKEKENYFIIAAMNNFIGQKDSAIAYLDKARNYTYKNDNWNEKNVKGFNKYMDDLIIQYQEFIRKEEDE
ncbi:MAG: DUF2225 domain-containing protein [Bacteroidota bacterium]